MKLNFIITLILTALFCNCATHRAADFKNYLTAGRTILVLPPTANINGTPIKQRLEEKKENIEALASDTLDVESDFIVDDGMEYGINVMTDAEYIFSQSLQNSLKKHLTMFTSDTLTHKFPCDVRSSMVSEYVLSECKMGYSNISDLSERLKEVCFNSKKADLLLLSRITGKYEKAVPLGTTEAIAGLISPDFIPLFDLARVLDIMPERRLTTIGTTTLETAIIDIKSSKVVFYEQSTVDIPPFYHETITELLNLNLEQIR